MCVQRGLPGVGRTGSGGGRGGRGGRGASGGLHGRRVPGYGARTGRHLVFATGQHQLRLVRTRLVTQITDVTHIEVYCANRVVVPPTATRYVVGYAMIVCVIHNDILLFWMCCVG